MNLRSLAKPSAILDDLPGLRSRRGNSVEHAFGIPLGPHGLETGILGAPEPVAPVGLVGIGLLSVSLPVDTKRQGQMGTYLIDISAPTATGISKRRIHRIRQNVLDVRLVR